MRVLGTAGHVDHGKSTLVAALTGIHPDRLKEEKEREMTIDLGFAWLSLPGGEEVGIVDVPGHRDFIENMLAGVGGIDAAMLVIAADEGIMPQTREHLAILDLLQVRTGVIVLSKIDLVNDPEWLDMVAMDIRKALEGSVLQEAPLVKVSAVDHTGLPELVTTLASMLANTPSRLDLHRPRLPVDRVFSMPGFGTVVTGTLSDGCLSVGDEVDLLPSGLHGRIRGLQTHRRKEDLAVPGSRTAVNITGMELADVRRGDVLTHPGQYRSSQRLDVHFRLLKDANSTFRHHTEVKVFLGTSEVIADARLLGSEILQPGESGWLQLDLHAPVVAVSGDRYIIRRPSPGETLGGGRVLDPHPVGRHKRFDKHVLRALEKLMQGSPADVFQQAAMAVGAAPVKDILSRAHLDESQLDQFFDEMVVNGQLVVLEAASQVAESVVVIADGWAELHKQVSTILENYHRTFPLRRGMPREELKSRLKMPPRLFNLVVRKLIAEGVIVEGTRWLAAPSHKVDFSPFEQVKVDRLMGIFNSTPFTPPSVKECIAEVGEETFEALRDRGDLVMVSSEVIFRRQDYELLLKRIRTMFETRERVTLAEVRDHLNTSRKFVQALLEHLDSLGITVREGDHRKLKV
jgi:selenocysteine-specific elongation factor